MEREKLQTGLSEAENGPVSFLDLKDSMHCSRESCSKLVKECRSLADLIFDCRYVWVFENNRETNSSLSAKSSQSVVSGVCALECISNIFEVK